MMTASAMKARQVLGRSWGRWGLQVERPWKVYEARRCACGDRSPRSSEMLSPSGSRNLRPSWNQVLWGIRTNVVFGSSLVWRIF